MDFVKILVQKNILGEENASKIEELFLGSGGDLDEIVLSYGVTERELMEAKGEFYHMPTRLVEEEIPYAVLKYVPEESARHYEFVPLALNDGVLEVGVMDAGNIEATDALQFISTRIKTPIKLFLLSAASFQKAISGYEGLTGQIEGVLSQLGGEKKGGSQAEKLSEKAKRQKEEARRRKNDSREGGAEIKGGGKSFSGIQKNLEDEIGDLTDGSLGVEVQKEEKEEAGEHIVDEAPVSKMVAVILRNAVEGKASDIHIEHIGDRVRVRFRIDGTLHTSIFLPANVHASVVSRIKILTSLKLDEKRKPQDGRFSAKIDGRRIDFRVSTYPAYFGEKVVMRILDSEKNVKSISDVGMRDFDHKKVKNAIKRPYGLILLTGPTGSGKSTSLYAMLNELDRDKDNIVSLEDPVEYQIPGVNQSNVRPEIDYTFATGLRSILRQDPDIIMVGEIRDKETAQLAIQAALTGHLVFSTLHTNTSAGVIPRLIDMGVDPYLIAPTLILAIGQRLVSKLCDGTGTEVPVDEAMRQMIDKQFEDLPEQYRAKIDIPDHVYEPASSDGCPSGLRGRQAVFEVLEVNDAVRHTILTNPVESEVFQTARENGMLTMKEDALLKAFDGVIPHTEVNTL